MENVHEIKEHQHHSRLAVFAIVGFLVVITFAVLFISQRVQNEQAYTTTTKASEINSSQTITDNNKKATSAFQLPANYNISEEISQRTTLEADGIDITNYTMQKTEDSCEYGVFLGYSSGFKRICPGADGGSCAYDARIYCPSRDIVYKIHQRACKDQSGWDEDAKLACCDQSCSPRWFDASDKDLCDAYCYKKNSEDTCQPDQVEYEGRKFWFWKCDVAAWCVPQQIGGPGSIQMPVNPNTTQ